MHPSCTSSWFLVTFVIWPLPSANYSVHSLGYQPISREYEEAVRQKIPGFSLLALACSSILAGVYATIPDQFPLYAVLSPMYIHFLLWPFMLCYCYRRSHLELSDTCSPCFLSILVQVAAALIFVFTLAQENSAVSMGSWVIYCIAAIACLFLCVFITYPCSSLQEAMSNNG